MIIDFAREGQTLRITLNRIAYETPPPASTLHPYRVYHTIAYSSNQTFKRTDTMTTRRLLIFQEARNPQNPAEIVYLPLNKLGLPICGPGPELPSILELPLRILRAFTEIFNQPKFKGWCVSRCVALAVLWLLLSLLLLYDAN